MYITKVLKSESQPDAKAKKTMLLNKYLVFLQAQNIAPKKNNNNNKWLINDWITIFKSNMIVLLFSESQIPEFFRITGTVLWHEPFLEDLPVPESSATWFSYLPMWKRLQ